MIHSFFNFIFIVDTITNVPLFPSFSHLSSALPPHFSLAIPRCCLCLWVMHVCSLANLFTFFQTVPQIILLTMFPMLYFTPSDCSVGCLFNSTSQQGSGSFKHWTENQVQQHPLLDTVQSVFLCSGIISQETFPWETSTSWFLVPYSDAHSQRKGVDRVVLQELKLTWILFCAF